MIEFTNVSMAYSDSGRKSKELALKDVSFTINDGEFVFIIGESGAGKSSIVKLLLREEKPLRGDIEVNGFRYSKLKRWNIPQLRRSIGVVFQDFRLISSLNVYDNVAFPLRVTGASTKDIKKRVPTLLDWVGMGHKAKSSPDQLSGGEQQRVAIARALVNHPKLILADEPTGNVDPHQSYEIVKMLDGFNKMGTTVVMVTHEHALAKMFDHRAIILDQGEVYDENYRFGGSHAIK